MLFLIVNRHTRESHIQRSFRTHCGTERQLGGAAAGPARSSRRKPTLLAVPSLLDEKELHDEKEFLQQMRAGPLDRRFLLFVGLRCMLFHSFCKPSKTGTPMPRMHILSAVEQDRFEQPPQSFDSVAGHHRNTLSAVMGQFQHARRVQFLGREASGYDRRSSPKSRSKSSLKIGRCQIDDIYSVLIEYRKSYGGFGTFEPLGPEFRSTHSETD